ncbi:MAG: DUF2911 domain-containing protein [Nonlabens sp.]
MKTVYSVFLFILIASTTFAQENKLFANLDASPLDVVMARDDDNTAVARIIYSRPSKRDREIFGSLVPYGEVWRTGANEATEIAFYKDMIVAGQKIQAGTYSIYTIPQEDNWTFILNSQTTQWGTQYDESKNILEAQINTMPSPTIIEAFSVNFTTLNDEIVLFMGWDETIAQVPIKIAE